MAIVDEIQLHLTAGRGGNGVVRWRQEKFIAKGGPAGGNGGRGGDIYAIGTRAMHTLAFYRHKKNFKAQNGDSGHEKTMQGKEGDDLFLKFPLGSTITNKATGQKFPILVEGEKVLLLTGGKGGWGNEHFKSSINTTPYEKTDGIEGSEADFYIELELVADIGLVGLPNAGKSSLLNRLTNAEAKVGDYQFTTLDPNLGDFHGYIIADIPGIIEGASEGKGLGVKFLKHIKRTKMLVHLISFENENMMEKYKEIRHELNAFGEGLDKKEEIILLTKTDVVTDPKLITKIINQFEKLPRVKKVFTLSLFDDKGVKEFSDELAGILKDGEEKLSEDIEETEE